MSIFPCILWPWYQQSPQTPCDTTRGKVAYKGQGKWYIEYDIIPHVCLWHPCPFLVSHIHPSHVGSDIKISYELHVRHGIGTRGMGFAQFAWRLLSAKCAKPTPRGPMLSFTLKPWEILFLPSYNVTICLIYWLILIVSLHHAWQGCPYPFTHPIDVKM